MKRLNALRRTFLAMPQNEKVLAGILAFILIFSFGKFFFRSVEKALLVERGALVEGFVGHIRNINPLYVDFNDADRDLSQLIFSGLMKYDPRTKNFLPDLAESLERSRDGLVYTFKIRPNVKWHDGESFGADDIVFTFKKVIQDPGFRNPILRNAFEGINIAKTGEFTVTFTLPKPNSYFISLLTVGILPNHILQGSAVALLDKNPFSENPIGAGPYKLNNLSLDNDGDFADLEAFDAFYGEKPKVKRFRFITYPNEKSLVADRKALHIISKIGSSSEAFGKLQDDARYEIFSYKLNQFEALYFNTENLVLKDKAARKALSLALNKDELVMGDEERVDTIDLKNLKNDPVFAWNETEAEKILSDLGWKKNQEGKLANDKGETIALTLLTMTKIPNELTAKIAASWKKLGIELKIERESPADFGVKVSERKYDVLLMRQSLGFNRDSYPLFHSSQTTGNGLNFANFKSFRTDGLTEALRKERDPPSKEKLLGELSKVLSEEIPVYFISTKVYSYLLPRGSQGFSVTELDFASDRLSLLPYLIIPNL